MLDKQTETQYEQDREAPRADMLPTWSGARASSHNSIVWVVCASLMLFIASVFVFYDYAHAGVSVGSYACKMQGKILKVGTGVSETTYFDEQENKQIFSVSFTELDVRVDRAIGNGCELESGRVAKLGLCQDISLSDGDYIKSDTDQWLYSPACLSNIKVLKRS